MDHHFAKQIIEACSNPEEYVSKQIYQIGDLKISHEIHGKRMHPQRVTVWCELCLSEIIGSFFFFENEASNAIAVNGQRHRKIFLSLIGDVDLEEL